MLSDDEIKQAAEALWQADVADAYRVGLTSKAMRDLTSATEPDYGFIYDNWFVLEGQSVERASTNRPLLEVELAFVMGNPINAVVWLANKLFEFGVTMQPGDVILSGSFVKAIPFDAGDSLIALYDQLGEITLSVSY